MLDFPPSPPADTITILLIDGNGEDRDYFAHRLNICTPDCVVIQAATGGYGLALCDAQKIDCVVLELDLPDMPGFEVLATLVQMVKSPAMPVIVLTKLTDSSLLELAIKNGAQAAFQKSRTSGDILDKAIVKAIATIQQKNKTTRQ